MFLLLCTDFFFKINFLPLNMESEILQRHAELPVGQPLAPKLKENAQVLCERKMLVSEKLCISKVKYIHAQPLIPHPPKIELQCSTSISLYFWSMLSEIML